MFLGSHSISMDAKGRLAIPARIRESLVDLCAGKLVVTAHTEERCLLVYPEPQWLEILPKSEALPRFNKVARRTQHLQSTWDIGGVKRKRHLSFSKIGKKKARLSCDCRASI